MFCVKNVQNDNISPCTWSRPSMALRLPYPFADAQLSGKYYCNASRPSNAIPNISLAILRTAIFSLRRRVWIAVNSTKRLAPTSAFFNSRISAKFNLSLSSKRPEPPQPAATRTTFSLASPYVLYTLNSTWLSRIATTMISQLVQNSSS